MKILVQGQIIRASNNLYWIKTNQQKELIQAKKGGNLLKDKITIIVGDNVELEWKNEHLHLIKKRLPRKNQLKRPLIANIECVFIINAIKAPKLDFVFLTKVLLWIEIKTQIKPILVFNKMDLLNKKDEENIQKINLYAQHYATVFTNKFEPATVQKLKKIIKGTSVFLGHSGVGKSTLFNLMNLDLNLKTKTVSIKTKLGRHQTTFTQYLMINNQLVADTPGFNKMEIDDLTKNELVSTFPFFSYEEERKCHFQPCFHNHEPKCIIKEKTIKNENYRFIWNIWKKILPK